MRVEIQSERVVIGQEFLPFYGYYFAIEADQKDSSWLVVMKEVLLQWAMALETLEENRAAFLP